MLEWLANAEMWIALATLTALEIVLGIDNIIFISVLVARLPAAQRNLARSLTQSWFVLLGNQISGRDVILIGGGLFLLAKATHEIHYSLEGIGEKDTAVLGSSLGMALVQISLLDIVFSLDSVITAVGLVEEVAVMAIAIILAVVVMMIAAKSIANFIDENPTIKMLALSFLILVGVTLMVEGFDVHVPKGYIYFAMAFSVAVEMLNIRVRKKLAIPVKLHSKYTAGRSERGS
jgi:predicted tellurium resistance membrane protein TerC